MLGVQRGPTEAALKSDGDPLAGIVGQTPSWTQLLEVVRRAAPTPATVLILGESGTGKELIARAVHQLSPRRAAPLVAVNCAALPESLVEAELFGFERGAFTGATMRRAGRFERAQGGTLFLDEIGELVPAVQVKLLRALQHREFERIGGTETLHADVRVVAATNRDLAAEMRGGRFREDLFYRLNVLTLVVPPLRERREDVPLLAEHFVRRFATVYGRPVHTIAPRAMQALARYAWPGNVRELENAIEHAVVLAPGPELRIEDLPAPLGTQGSAARAEPQAAQTTLYEIEREAILRALRLTGGSTGRAARMLGISARKIQYKLKEYAAAPTLSADAVDAGPPDEEPDLGDL